MKQEEIPTIEDYLKEIFNGKLSQREAMQEFAKLHVTQALKAADDNSRVTVIDYEDELEPPKPIWGVDSNSILSAYPLDNIK
jgi:hypothetical protein